MIEVLLAVIVLGCIGASCLVITLRRDQLAAIWFLLLGLLVELIQIELGLK
jgi:hypothetical protein